jgi:hypothetical protein
VGVFGGYEFMSRVKLLFLSIIAASAVGAMAASAASAAPHWVINKTALASGSSESVLGLLSGGNASLRATISTIPTDILCTAADATGTITGPNKDEAASGITFSGCTVSKPTGCTVTNPIVVKPLTSELLATETGGIGFDTWSPKTGEEFVSLTISGSACSVEGVYPVKGKAQCEGTLNTEAETYACLFSDTSGKGLLKLGSNEATFLAHFLFLLKGANDGQNWGVAAP